MNFIPWDLKKFDKIAWPWNLTLTGEIEFWWHIYNFDNLNLIAKWISILCMSLFYTKWRKSNYFEEFWPILYDTLFYFIDFRSLIFRFKYIILGCYLSEKYKMAKKNDRKWMKLVCLLLLLICSLFATFASTILSLIIHAKKG